MDIKKDIDNCIENFIEELEAIKDGLETERRSAVEGNLKLLNMEQALKSQKEANIVLLENEKKNIHNEVEKQKKILDEIEISNIELSLKKKEYETKIREIEASHKEAMAFKNEMENRLNECTAKSMDLDIKLKSIKDDFDIVDRKKKEFVLLKRELEEKSNAIKLREEQLIEKEIEIARSYEDIRISKRNIEHEKAQEILKAGI